MATNKGHLLKKIRKMLMLQIESAGTKILKLISVVHETKKNYKKSFMISLLISRQ